MSQAPVAGPQSNVSSPAQLCEKYDKGGGTGIQGTFAIYSIRPLPQPWETVASPKLAAQLIQAAAAVAQTISIYFQLSDIDEEDLHSFSTSSPAPHAAQSQTPRLPWFLVNAAISEEHYIVGRGSIVETLLVILRRPWCILEVCCCEYETVRTMLEFAILAREFEPKAYAASVYLLSHEVSKRQLNPNEHVPVLPLAPGRPSQPEVNALQGIYTVLSPDGIQSHNPFWLRVICVCGVQLGIAFSDFLRGMCGTKVVLIPERIGSPVRYPGMIRRAFTENPSVKHRGSDHEQRGGFQVHSIRLVSLYKQIVQELTEEVS
ncbi:hypothetical protein TWF106_005663 [Orbilia oligospora]|uniref:Uncharacterized protein n=1 Tax=Orbilia oligospora TaxID=2813651 RepID=A0A7C8Q0E2_ORBOL|nr:hypothetical protein TWF788_003633 [Orbilia oligospora]KAF3222246.1 hypothetical protein TWF106_005663 [Orbilia oligospora]